MECKLVEHVNEMDELFYRLTRKQIMKLAYDYAVINNLDHRFQKGMAGQK